MFGPVVFVVFAAFATGILAQYCGAAEAGGCDTYSMIQTRPAVGHRVAASPTTIVTYQWNPHYECFGSEAATCSGPALEQIKNDLTDAVDFANIVELENHDDFEVSGFKRSHYACEGATGDQISMFYDFAKWDPLTPEPTQGCFSGNSRVFQVWAFASKADTNFKVVVAGAHFDHANPGSLSEDSIEAVGGAIGEVAKAAGASRLLFLGDTNVYYDATTGAGATKEILSALLAKAGSPFQPDAPAVSTDLGTSTCCYNQGGTSSFPANCAFDRIFANFGSSMSTTVLDVPQPSWADFSKFHRAVRGVLQL